MKGIKDSIERFVFHFTCKWKGVTKRVTLSELYFQKTIMDALKRLDCR